MLVLLVLAAIGFEVRYSGRLHPGVKVLGADVGGRTVDEAASIIERLAQEDMSRRLVLRYGDDKVSARVRDLGLTVDTRTTATRALDIGREGGMLHQWVERFRVWRGGRQAAPTVTLDRDEASDLVRRLAAKVDRPVRDASVEMSPQGPALRRSRVGLKIDAPATVASLSSSIEATYYERAAIHPVVLTTQPAVKEADLARTQKMLSAAWTRPLVLTFKGRNWKVSTEDVRPHIKLEGQGTAVRPTLDIAFLRDRVGKVAGSIDRSRRNARLQILSGSVHLVAGRSGYHVDVEKTVRQLQMGAFSETGRSPVVVDVKPPELTNAELLPTVQAADAMVRRPLQLQYGDRSWSLSTKQLTHLLRWRGTGAERSAYVDPAALSSWVQGIAQDVDTSARSARIEVTEDGAKVIPDRDHVTVLVEETVTALQSAIQAPEGRVDLRADSVPAAVQAEDLKQAAALANRLIQEPVTLALDGDGWTADPAELRDWLRWRGEGASVTPYLDAAELRRFAESISSEASSDPQNAYLSTESGAPEMVPDVVGVDIDVDSTAAVLQKLAESGERNGAVVSISTTAAVTEADLQPALDRARLLTGQPITLSLNGNLYTAGTDTLVDWLRWDDSNADVLPYLDSNQMNAFAESISQQASRDVQDAYLSATDGTLYIEPEVDGVQIDVQATADLLSQLAVADQRSGEVVATQTAPNVTEADLQPSLERGKALTGERLDLTLDGDTWWLDPEDLIQTLYWTDNTGADTRVYLGVDSMESEIRTWVKPPSGVGIDYAKTAKDVIVALKNGTHTVEITATKKQAPKDGAIKHTGDEAYWNGKFPDKWIDLNLASQTIAAYKGKKQVRVSYITSGRPELPTPTGVYSIMAKLSPYKFISPWPKDSKWYYPPSDTTFALRFREGGFYIHDAPWRKVYGPGTNGSGPTGDARTGSHGCVNVPYKMEAWLYTWSDIGTPVVIHP